MQQSNSLFFLMLFSFFGFPAESSYPHRICDDEYRRLEDLFPQVAKILQVQTDDNFLEDSISNLKREAVEELVPPSQSKTRKVVTSELPSIELSPDERTNVCMTAYRSYCQKSPEKTILVLKAAEELLSQKQDFSHADMEEKNIMPCDRINQILTNLTSKFWLEITQKKGRKHWYRITPKGRYALQILEKYKNDIKSLPQEYLSKITVGENL